MIDREQLAADLARTHGIRIEADDPILAAVLLNRRLLDEAIAALEAAVRVSADRMTAASLQQTDAARQAAGILITQAGEWSAGRLGDAAREAAAAVAAELETALARVDRSRRAAVSAAAVAVCGCAFTLAALLGIWLAGTCHG